MLPNEFFQAIRRSPFKEITYLCRNFCFCNYQCKEIFDPAAEQIIIRSSYTCDPMKKQTNYVSEALSGVEISLIKLLCRRPLKIRLELNFHKISLFQFLMRSSSITPSVWSFVRAVK